MKGHVTIIGLGNIGAALCDLLMRQPEVRRLTLVDADVYTEANLRTQCITKAEVGRPKARAQTRRIKRVRPELQVTAHCDRAENLPVGYLNSDLICACLDTRVSRMYVNEIAWRLNVPWIDAGVLASEMLARVDVFVPGADAPCLECSFGDQHYATMEVRHPCQKDGTPLAPPTNAPAYLGALAASMQAAVCHKLLGGRGDDIHAGEQALYGIHSRHHFVSRNRRNPDCRFDHRVFTPQELPGNVPIKDLLARQNLASSTAETYLSAPGRRFLTGYVCPTCGRDAPSVQCVASGVSPTRACKFCGGTSAIHPDKILERLSLRAAPHRLEAKSVRSLGLRVGDLFTVGDDSGERHYLVT